MSFFINLYITLADSIAYFTVFLGVVIICALGEYDIDLKVKIGIWTAVFVLLEGALYVVCALYSPPGSYELFLYELYH